MVTETLVSFDIDNGQKVVDALIAAGKEPNVALWAKLTDYESWRLIIASDRLDQTSESSGISEIIQAMRDAGIVVHRRPTILMLPMEHPMIQDLRSGFANSEDTYGMRLGGRVFGGKFLEDAFVYRIR
jgi:hypothetical protein